MYVWKYLTIWSNFLSEFHGDGLQKNDQVEELEAISEALAALQTLTEVLEILAGGCGENAWILFEIHRKNHRKNL